MDFVALIKCFDLFPCSVGVDIIAIITFLSYQQHLTVRQRHAQRVKAIQTPKRSQGILTESNY